MTIITGEDRRRKWSFEERHRILAEAFAPGAVVSKVARQFDVASSMVYKWRREAQAASCPLAFVPAIVVDDVATPSRPSEPPLPSAPPAPAITVEYPTGVRVTIGGSAPAALVTAALRALH